MCVGSDQHFLIFPERSITAHFFPDFSRDRPQLSILSTWRISLPPSFSPCLLVVGPSLQVGNNFSVTTPSLASFSWLPFHYHTTQLTSFFAACCLLDLTHLPRHGKSHYRGKFVRTPNTVGLFFHQYSFSECPRFFLSQVRPSCDHG